MGQAERQQNIRVCVLSHAYFCVCVLVCVCAYVSRVSETGRKKWKKTDRQAGGLDYERR